MPRQFAVLTAVLFALLLTLAVPNCARTQAPAGWTTRTVGTQTVYTPPDLKGGEFYCIIVFPRAALGGAALTDYLAALTEKEVAALGTPSGGAIASKGSSHNATGLVRFFVSKQGRLRLAENTAISVDAENVRVISAVMSQDVTLLKRYQPSVVALEASLTDQEKADALESGRGLSFEKTADAPGGMRPGGPIVPGIYAGNGVTSNDGNIRDRYRVSLYATGEYLICDDGGKEYEFGHGDCKYDPITGKLQMGITFTFNNNPTDPEREFCFYGKGADGGGKPYIYARSDRGYGYLTIILRYAGPTDKPSPKQQEAAKAAAEAEAKRYKFVTAPGKGVQPSQIAGIVHHYEVRIGQGAALNESYLLLKDGTVHDGLPVPPDEMDVPLSRRREPEKWGRWRREGTKFLAAWPDGPDRFAPLPGVIALPAMPGERLNGHFATGETSGSVLLGGSYRLWGVTFSQDGRFVKDNQGGSSSGAMGQTMNDFSVDTAYDDDGSVTSFSSPSVVGYAKNKKRGSARAGTYSISGYTLTLHYDNGRVARLPFFFDSEKKTQLYFDGDTLGRDDAK